MFFFSPIHTEYKCDSLLRNPFKKRATIKRERASVEKVLVNGYRFVIASQSATTIYLKCANFRNNCKARASKRKNSNEIFVTKNEHNNCIPSSPDFEGPPLHLYQNEYHMGLSEKLHFSFEK